MEPLPESIGSFIRDHHVVGLAMAAGSKIWAASCFYAFDADQTALVLLSSKTTRHGQLMLANPVVAGTIAGQPESVLQIRGLQFSAQATKLEGEEATLAYRMYCRRHPVARLRKSDIWRILLDEIKYTDNASVFGHKTFWQRTP